MMRATLSCEPMAVDLEFWPMKVVAKKVGLSQTEIYRRIADGRFPRGLHYADGGKRKFWLSTEIIEWQEAIIARNEDQPQ
jgi:predicted DNA-binding transcriptional regulator AlpA